MHLNRPMRSWRTAIAAGAATAVVIAIHLTGCAPMPSLPGCPGSGCPTVATARSPASPSASLASLPGGFPVMDGAVTVAGSRADVLATWRVDATGSAAYDFYLTALPGAGFPVLGAYPSERSALIRLRAPDGTILQLVAELSNGGTLISVRPDRP